MNLKRENSVKIMQLLAALVFVYLCLRAIYVPLIHDEAGTFFMYMQKGTFLRSNSYFDANNHLMNSITGWIGTKIFGIHTWSVRLPNLFAAGIGMIFLFQLRRFFNHQNVWFCFVITFLFTHNFIEYFAYARGYGMAINFLLPTIFYLLKSKEEINWKNSLFFVASVGVSLWSSFTLLNALLLISGVFLAQILLLHKRKIHFFVITFLLGVLFLSAVYYLLLLKSGDKLYYGSNHGIWKVTLQTLTELLLNIKNEFTPFPLVIIALLFFLTAFLLFKKVSFSKFISSKTAYFSLFLLGSFIAFLFMQWLLNINFPEDRAALFLYPLFLFFIFFTFDEFEINNKKWKRFFQIPIFMLPLFFVIHFLFSMNLSHTTFWKNERVPQGLLSVLYEKTKLNRVNTSVSAYKLLSYNSCFENLNRKNKLNPFYSSQYPSSFCDFIIADPIFFNSNSLKAYKMIWHDNISGGLSLLERRKKIQWIPIFDSTFNDFQNKFSSNYNEYISLIDTNFPKTNTSFAIDFSFEIEWNSLAELEVIFKGELNKTLEVEENFHLSWTYCNEKITKVHHRMFLDSPNQLDKLNCFIYNKRKGEMKIKNLKVQLFSAN